MSVTNKTQKTTTNLQFNTIEEAIQEIKQGKVVIVVDDEDRENEGDFLAAAELITPETINFMATHGRGLLCTPMLEKDCKRLGLNLMVNNSTDPKQTAFTVSVDLLGDGVTTGISATDRAKTILAMMNEQTKAEQLSRPGHIFPLIAKDGGVLRRPGHTEAAIDLTKLAGLKPGGVIVEIMNEDGSMARLPELIKIAKKFDLKIINIQDLIAYRLTKDSLVEKIDQHPIKTKFGDFDLCVFKQTNNNQVHFALTKGEYKKEEAVAVKVISSTAYYDLFSALHMGETPILEKVFYIINQQQKGAVIFINNILDSQTLLQKVQKFKEYSQGTTKNPTPKKDELDYGIGAQIIKQLGIGKIQLITRNPNLDMEKSVSGYGLEIVKTIPLD